jgi:dienelactone hydrolase
MLNSCLVKALCTAGVLFTAASPAWPGSSQVAEGGSVPPVVSAAQAPAGFEPAGVRWIEIPVQGQGVLLAAVARPAGTGPFPAVIVLHGSHGFAEEYVGLARDLARGGILGVAACWFSGGSGPGSRFVTPIRCADAPAMPGAASAEAMWIVDALVTAVGSLHGADRDRVGLFGHSRGGGAVLNYVLGGGKIRAAVLHSAGYPTDLADRIPRLAVPILMLHGTADVPADGGSALTNVRMARGFESALRRAGKRVEAMYYEGGGHNGIFTNPAQRRDEVRRTVAFCRRYLRR